MIYCISCRDIIHRGNMKYATVELFADKMPDVLPNNGKNIIGLTEEIKFRFGSELRVRGNPFIYIYTASGFMPDYKVGKTQQGIKGNEKIKISKDGAVYAE